MPFDRVKKTPLCTERSVSHKGAGDWIFLAAWKFKQHVIDREFGLVQDLAAMVVLATMEKGGGAPSK